MNQICRDIFRAIHEGKWLKIEYRNKADQVTKYWIGIRDLDPRSRTMKVDGLHLGQLTIGEYDRIFIDSILSTEIIEGTYCPENKILVEDIEMHPERYKNIFDSSANLKILNYLEICNKLDTTPYITDYDLIHYIDRDRINCGMYQLTDQQFREVVAQFQYFSSREKRKSGSLKVKRLAINVLSINTNKGLYVLAYRNLNLDVKNHIFKPDEEITVCTQFSIDGKQENARKFLDADEYELLEDFEKNLEKIKDAITEHGGNKSIVDDMPYVIGLGMDVVLNLHEEYKAIMDMFEADNVTYPIKAFFGELLERPRRTKAYPIALINKNINLDQLLAINNAMKYPLAYIQGPPGTGKTNTIINTIVTAFFNNVTVLFASYNNVPIDNVFEKLSSMKYRGKTIPFPVLRLGNTEKVMEAIKYINELRTQVQSLQIFASTLDKRKDDRIDRAKRLSARLKEYEEILDLKERKETLTHLMKYQEHMKNTMKLLPFQTDLQGYQMQKLDKRIAAIGEISDADAMQLLDRNEDEFYQYLFYTSARYIKALEEPKFQELRQILDSDETPEKLVNEFNKYMRKSENVRKLQRVFPIIITTCISAHKIGEPEPLFDMTIMDEAKEKLVLLTNGKELERLHAGQADDDLYELAQYIKTNGHSKITEKHISSRALGIQPFSTATENAFLENLTHALENIWLSQSKYVIHKEVAISQVFRDNITYDDLFYMGRFDFVVYEKQGRSELPILAIELDGKEHFDDAVVKERDRKKNAICKAHNMEIIRVENSYARRYNHIKGILMDYFSRVH